ncbi:hypothetical protein V6N11_059911 [Hibiscus sabdariffa]|uniref:HSA domain-containing protein n=2 Tax=Hibiscus sabdariffa TaxID=183260 RepID=A0ABR2BHY1_9ROSI
MRPRKKNTVVTSEQSSRMDGTQNTKESEDFAIFRPYARRNRSRINRDGLQSSPKGIVKGRGGHGLSLPAHVASKDVKALTSEANNKHGKNIPCANTTKLATSNGDLPSKMVASDNQLNMELDGGDQATEETTNQSKTDVSESNVDVTVSKSLIDDLHKDHAQVEADKSAFNWVPMEPGLVAGKEQIVSTGFDVPLVKGATQAENETSYKYNQLNGFGDAKRDGENMPNELQNNSVAVGTKGLDSVSFSTQNCSSLYVNKDTDMCTNPENVDSNDKLMGQTSEKEESLNLAVGEMAKENNEIKAVDNGAVVLDTCRSVNQNHILNDSIVKVEEEIRYELQNEAQQSSHNLSVAERKVSAVPSDNSKSYKDNFSTSLPQGTMDNTLYEIPDTQYSLDNHVKVVDKAQEDSIMEEARIIEAKRKRIADLSVGSLSMENRQKSHWNFVLEEMAWLANDFAQERLWKMTAAAQICRRVAFTSQLKFEGKTHYWKLRKVALIVANAVMDFWHSAELQRLMDFLRTTIQNLIWISDPGIMDSSWDEHLTEESLFYAVPSGATETYRRSIESYLVQTESYGPYNFKSGFGYGDFVYDKDEGETSTYLLPGAFEGGKSSKLNQKRGTNSLKFMKSYPARSYNVGAGLPYGNCAQQSTLIAAAGGFQAPTKADASSGDTNSCRDDQSTLNGGFQIQKSMEIESTGEFERQLPYNCAEESTKPKKKKKTTNLGSAYDEGWQLESTHNELEICYLHHAKFLILSSCK